MKPYKDDLPNGYIEILKRICKREKYAALISEQSLRGLWTHATCNIVPIPDASFSHMASMIISKGSPYKRLFTFQ
jgi:hypothetical protein